jgi:hypothetical protein
MLQKLKLILLGIVLIPLFLLFIGFGLETTLTTPDHSYVLVDKSSNEYYSPPCIMSSGYDDANRIYEFAEINSLEVVEKIHANDKNYKPNPECRDNQGFIQEGRSMSGSFLEKLGILPELESRWNDDGSWKW